MKPEFTEEDTFRKIETSIERQRAMNKNNLRKRFLKRFQRNNVKLVFLKPMKSKILIMSKFVLRNVIFQSIFHCKP